LDTLIALMRGWNLPLLVLLDGDGAGKNSNAKFLLQNQVTLTPESNVALQEAFIAWKPARYLVRRLFRHTSLPRTNIKAMLAPTPKPLRMVAIKDQGPSRFQLRP